MSGIAAESVWPDKRAAVRRFDGVAATFAGAAFIHDEARSRLLGRLEYLRIEPALIADVGSGPGAGARALRERFPAARIIAIDASRAMLAQCARTGGADVCVQADAERLPLADASVDLLFANLLLPWCRPDVFSAEVARVLKPDGLLLASTVGPDTLSEVRKAWRAADAGIHVHGFLDMHDLGDLLSASGLAEPVMDVDRLTVTYDNAAGLFRDLTAAAARNAAAGRQPGLTSRARWSGFVAALESQRAVRLGVGIELIFAQAWGRGAPAGSRRDATGEIAVPVDRIGRR